MIFELREYTAAAGRRDDLLARFREHTLSLFDAHGMTIEGIWLDTSGEEDVIYLLSFESKAAQKKAWAMFVSDPRWRRAKELSEATGPIVSSIRARTLGSFHE